MPRPHVNGAPVFQVGALDQGYWPDGVYTAPSDAAVAWDVAAQRSLGFNAQRHHMKVEPRRFYYHADRAGLLVWQDMPSPLCSYGGDEATFARVQRAFAAELGRLVAARANHPSIVQWDIFNEGCATQLNKTTWSAAWFEEVVAIARAPGDGRLIDVCSGCDDHGYGDLSDEHKYAHTADALTMLPYDASVAAAVVPRRGRRAHARGRRPRLGAGEQPGWAPSPVPGCEATAHWAGYAYSRSTRGARPTERAWLSELLGNIAGEVDGVATVTAGLNGSFSVDGDAASPRAPFAANASDSCADACARDDACVAWDFLADGARACRFFGTLLSFAPNDDAEGRAGGLEARGRERRRSTGATDIETGATFYTYDRRALNDQGLHRGGRGARAALIAAQRAGACLHGRDRACPRDRVRRLLHVRPPRAQVRTTRTARACTLSAGPASLTLARGASTLTCRHTGLRLQKDAGPASRVVRRPVPLTDVSGWGEIPPLCRHLLSPCPGTGTPPQAKSRWRWVGAFT